MDILEIVAVELADIVAIHVVVWIISGLTAVGDRSHIDGIRAFVVGVVNNLLLRVLTWIIDVERIGAVVLDTHVRSLGLDPSISRPGTITWIPKPLPARIVIPFPVLVETIYWSGTMRSYPHSGLS